MTGRTAPIFDMLCDKDIHFDVKLRLFGKNALQSFSHARDRRHQLANQWERGNSSTNEHDENGKEVLCLNGPSAETNSVQF